MGQKYISGYRAQTREKSLRYTVSFSLLVLFMAIFQVSVFGRYKLFGAVPDLMLCTVLCVAFFSGRYAGAITGVGAGFLIEALGSTGLSLLPVAYLILGYVVGYYAKGSAFRRFPSYLICRLVGVLARGALTGIYVYLLYDGVAFGRLFLHTLLPEAAATALCGVILYFPILMLCRVLERKKSAQ